MSDITQMLLKSWQRGRLAHFYIITPHPEQPQAEVFIDNWMHSFLCQIIKKERGDCSNKDAARLLEVGHPDILELKSASASDNYCMADGFGTFFKFMEFKNFSFQHRFIIFHNAHLLPANLTNKLLKSLEEPQDTTSIFFLNPGNHKFLPTIKSRAIWLALPLNIETAVDTFPLPVDPYQWFYSNIPESFPSNCKEILLKFAQGEDNLSSLIDSLRKERELRVALLKLLLRWECGRESDYAHKQAVLSEIKWFQMSETYYNPPVERLQGLLRAIFY